MDLAMVAEKDEGKSQLDRDDDLRMMEEVGLAGNGGREFQARPGFSNHLPEPYLNLAWLTRGLLKSNAPKSLLNK
jgi:hypothetical protein